MNTIIMIPARLSSTRLARKPLADIKGKPMIVHVMERALESQMGRVVVACCGQEIAEVVEKHGGTAVITDPALPSGTDRIAAALTQIDPQQKYEIVVNLQGDLPFVTPEAIHRVVMPFQNKDVDMSTLTAVIENQDEITNPNVVKIALCNPMQSLMQQGQSRCIYFSRQPIPDQAKTYYHHIGIYAYRRDALHRFVALPPSYLEQTERLEQLRALEAGMRIDAMLIDYVPQSVDTAEDLEKLK